jgi:hypothetical protein
MSKRMISTSTVGTVVGTVGETELSSTLITARGTALKVIVTKILNTAIKRVPEIIW